MKIVQEDTTSKTAPTLSPQWTNAPFLFFRNVVKAFYSAGMLLDVCMVFGEMNEDVAQQKK